ncbi:MAG: hypothetical protein H8E44_20905 [Planctomycetes bacterium]|nr:hypothetical protein [Planctomycetota bacterium]MBL7043210.1 hypothetical protein [Pirellulaceae bacterium]
MAADWYYRIAGGELVPLPWEQLFDLYATGGTATLPLMTGFFSCAMPWMALLSSIALIGAGGAYLVSLPVRRRVNDLLRPNPEKATRNNIIVGGMAACGVLLLAFSVVAIRHTSYAEEDREKVELANEQVAPYIATAQDYLEQGDLSNAEKDARKATAVADATETGIIATMRATIQDKRREEAADAANQKVGAELHQAKIPCDARQMGRAIRHLDKAVPSPVATEVREARDLLARARETRARELRPQASDQVGQLDSAIEESIKAGQLEKVEPRFKETLTTEYAPEVDDARKSRRPSRRRKLIPRSTTRRMRLGIIVTRAPSSGKRSCCRSPRT